MSSSNSYRLVWTDAAINRDTNNLVSASIELFRNGDVAVATNGVAALLPCLALPALAAARVGESVKCKTIGAA